jgi:hypothetical protein
MTEREIRRLAGYLFARLPEADLGAVSDPRQGWTKWALRGLLNAVVSGLMAGCKGLAEIEEFTRALSQPMRRRLGFGGRVPDTTARDVICRLAPNELREALHRIVRAAKRRKALEPVDFPFSVLTLDGKVTAIPCWGDFVQRRFADNGVPYGLVRTVTCTLVKAAGRPCIDAIPIPAETNEMGHFRYAFQAVNESFGKLFRLVTYDAGALSEENGRIVVEAGKDYLFRLKGEQRTMYKLAEEHFAAVAPVAQTVDILDKRRSVTRRLSLLTLQQHWAYGDGKAPAESAWSHARTFVQIEAITTTEDVETSRETRLYVSSLREGRLSPYQWLALVRGHWGVEVNHNTLDTAFDEDERPGIVANDNGVLVMIVLRRIAYTLLTLFRSVTQKSEQRRHTPFKTLMQRLYSAAVAASEITLAGLRSRARLHVRA